MFSFVDQITSIDGGEIRGRFALPEHFGGARDWLLAEAIGQLAGWLGMRDSEFQSRPVGATVHEILLAEDRRVSGVLELSASIQRTDRRAILYRGSVASAGREIAAMNRCIGPFLPMDTLESSDSARSRFDALRSGQPQVLWKDTDAVPAYQLDWNDDRAVAEFWVERDADLFDEHFPRQPVVPATLMIDAMGRTACAAYAAALGCAVDSVLFTEVRQVKVRRFTKPGDRLQLRGAIEQPHTGEVKVQAQDGGDKVATVSVFCRERG